MTKAEGIQKVFDYMKAEHPDLGVPNEDDLKLIDAIFDAAADFARIPWREFGEHLLAMEALTPGGSNEGWLKRLLSEGDQAG